jgi:hypothetical protein
MYNIYTICIVFIIYTIIFISHCASIHLRIRHTVFINTYLCNVLNTLVCIWHHYNTEKVYSSALAWLRLVVVVFGYTIHFPRTDKCTIIPLYSDSNPLKRLQLFPSHFPRKAVLTCFTYALHIFGH